MRDPYDVLGVSRKASEAEIKKAFRTLAKKHHPDTHANDPKAVKKFQEISAAYEVIGDKEKRTQYDRGEIDVKPGDFVKVAIDALEDLMAKAGAIDCGRITRITVDTYRLAASKSQKNVTGSFGAKFSIPFAAATILYHGRSSLEAFSEAAVANPAINALAQRVEDALHPELTCHDRDEFDLGAREGDGRAGVPDGG